MPISLVYKKGVSRDGTAPLPAVRLRLLRRDDAGRLLAGAAARCSTAAWSYALAHIRGGNDMGQTWHDDGKMLNKKNTFTDFIACADHLVPAEVLRARPAGDPGRQRRRAARSAPTINLRPDLCKAAVLQVPFVDVINTMLDRSLPLTVQEFLEWGNPNVKAEYDYMKSYCPYTNLAAKDYPSMLVTTSLNDSQVMYREPTKYVAKLRTLKTDKNPLLFKCNMAGGHGGVVRPLRRAEGAGVSDGVRPGSDWQRANYRLSMAMNCNKAWIAHFLQFRLPRKIIRLLSCFLLISELLATVALTATKTESFIGMHGGSTMGRTLNLCECLFAMGRDFHRVRPAGRSFESLKRLGGFATCRSRLPTKPMPGWRHLPGTFRLPSCPAAPDKPALLPAEPCPVLLPIGDGAASRSGRRRRRAARYYRQALQLDAEQPRWWLDYGFLMLQSASSKKA